MWTPSSSLQRLPPSCHTSARPSHPVYRRVRNGSPQTQTASPRHPDPKDDTGNPRATRSQNLAALYFERSAGPNRKRTGSRNSARFDPSDEGRATNGPCCCRATASLIAWDRCRFERRRIEGVPDRRHSSRLGALVARQDFGCLLLGRVQESHPWPWKGELEPGTAAEACLRHDLTSLPQVFPTVVPMNLDTNVSLIVQRYGTL